MASDLLSIASSGARAQQIEAVNAVLAEIGAATIPQVLVWNKIDLTAFTPGLERDEYGKICRVSVSAKTGVGLDLLRVALAEFAAAKQSTAANPELEHQQKDSYVT